MNILANTPIMILMIAVLVGAILSTTITYFVLQRKEAKELKEESAIAQEPAAAETSAQETTPIEPKNDLKAGQVSAHQTVAVRKAVTEPQTTTKAVKEEVKKEANLQPKTEDKVEEVKPMPKAEEPKKEEVKIVEKQEEKVEPKKEIKVEEVKTTPKAEPKKAEKVEEVKPELNKETPVETPKTEEVVKKDPPKKKKSIFTDKTIGHLLFNKNTNKWEYRLKKSGEPIETFDTEKSADNYITHLCKDNPKLLIFKEKPDGTKQALK